MGWWAAQASGEPAAAGHTVRLCAKATGRGGGTRTAGHHHDARQTGPATDQAPAPEQIRIKATAFEDGKITRTGKPHSRHRRAGHRRQR